MKASCYSLLTLLAYVPALGTEPPTPAAPTNTPSFRSYAVDRLVADFPGVEDMSTPEAAYVVFARFLATGGDKAAAQRLAVKRNERHAAGSAPDTYRTRVLPSTHILEVLMWEGTYAGVIAKLPEGRKPYDIRHLEWEDGRWLNRGNDRRGSREEARTHIRRSWAMLHSDPYPHFPVADPEAYLQRHVDFLKEEARDPAALVKRAIATHKILIMGEIHHRPRYWDFNESLVREPGFPGRVGTIYMELPSHGQALVDQFLAAEELDVMPVIEMLRDMLWMGWPDQAMLDFFVTVWRVNQALPPAQRVRIVLVDMARPWSEIQKREDWRKYDTDRDRLMADNILQDLAVHPTETRNALFITGIGHASLAQQQLTETVSLSSAGFHLRQELGTDQVYAVIPHMPRITNMGEVRGRLALGLFDHAFAERGNRPLAFPLRSGPFGKLPFDARPEFPPSGTYGEAYSAFLYLGPLEDEHFAALIPGFYTDAFVQELDRRHAMMHGKGLVEGIGLAAVDGESFTAWMNQGWGQPRDWSHHLGPVDAWRYGADWVKVLRARQHQMALGEPDRVKAAAQALFDTLRSMDHNVIDGVSERHRSLYDPYRGYDEWVGWILRTFAANPVASVTLGTVFVYESGHPMVEPHRYNPDFSGYPTVPYELSLRDGTVLAGYLPFEYQVQSQTWLGKYGLDWHWEHWHPLQAARQ